MFEAKKKEVSITQRVNELCGAQINAVIGHRRKYHPIQDELDQKQEKIRDLQSQITKLQNEIDQRIAVDKSIAGQLAKINGLKLEITEREKKLPPLWSELKALRDEEFPLIQARDRAVVQALRQLKPEIETKAQEQLLIPLAALVSWQLQSEQIIGTYHINIDTKTHNHLFASFWEIADVLANLRSFCRPDLSPLAYEAFRRGGSIPNTNNPFLKTAHDPGPVMKEA